MKTTKKTAAKIAWAIAAVMMAFSLALTSCGGDDDEDNNNSGGGGSGTGSGSEGTATTVAETKTTLDAVGDIYLSDGTVIASANANKMSSEQKSKAEAVVFYVGTSGNALGNRTLAVNIKNSGSKGYSWAPPGTTGYTTNFTVLQCEYSTTQPTSGTYYTFTYTYTNTYGSSSTTTYYVTGDLDGSDNWASVQAADVAGTANAATNYPAFNYVNTVLGSQYYLPTLAELEELYKNISTVNTSITAAGGTELSSGYYWSSSQYASNNLHARYVSLSSGNAFNTGKKDSNLYVCGVRAFSNATAE